MSKKEVHPMLAARKEEKLKKIAASKDEKLKALALSYGYDNPMDMIERAVFDGTCPAVCLNCDYTTDMEPDQTEGYCEKCQTSTVVSCMVLAGII